MSLPKALPRKTQASTPAPSTPARRSSPAPAPWCRPCTSRSTYAQDGIGGLRDGYEYGRGTNPTRDSLQEQLAALEGGSAAFSFSSGLAAEDSMIRALTRPGDHIVLGNDAYGGTYRLISRVLGEWGIGNTPVDMSDLDAVAAAVAAAARRRRRQDPPRVGGDAVQPDDEDHRHRGARQGGARRRRPPRGGQHLRLPVPADPARPRRRHRGALHHQVHRRPLRRRRRRDRGQRRRNWRRRSASSSSPSAPCPGRWTPSSPPAG